MHSVNIFKRFYCIMPYDITTNGVAPKTTSITDFSPHKDKAVGSKGLYSILTNFVVIFLFQ